MKMVYFVFVLLVVVNLVLYIGRLGINLELGKF